MDRPARLIAIALVLLAAALPAASQEARKDDLLRLAFAVDLSRPESGAIRITLTLSNNDQETVRLAIPAWAPGAYRIREYHKDVKEFRAADPSGKKLDVTRLDDLTWGVRAGGVRTVTVDYALAVEKLRLDKDHCFLPGPETFLYVVDRKQAPCRVRFTLPEGWRVGTGLDPEGEEYVARDYDTLIDCPIELGKFELFEFLEEEVRYQLVVHAIGPVNGPKLVDMCRKIVQEQNRIFGGAPFKRYVFLYHFRSGDRGAGLEHLNSTNIAMPYMAVRSDPLLAASVTSHEYFHLWNVKRIRPLELGPFDYTKPVRSSHLWLCEGVTSYFGDRTLARCGIWSEERYLQHLAGEIEALQNNPDRKVTGVAKASRVVWDRKDYPRVDYYNKGELLGLLMDLKIRRSSGSRKNFDDVMRHLYEGYVVGPSKAGKGPIGVGFPEEGIRRALEEVTGEEWKDFYERYVTGVEELPYAEILGPAGLEVAVTVTKQPHLGVDLGGALILNVPEGGVAGHAGLKAGDRIFAIDGKEVARSTIRGVLAGLKVGQDIKLRIQRGEETVEIDHVVGEVDRASARVRRSADPTAEQKKLLDAWLGKRASY